MWSVGCILCEFLGRRPLFTAHDSLDLLRQIVAMRGTPREEDLQWVSAPGRSLLGRCPGSPGVELSVLFPGGAADALALASELLSFNPEARPDAVGALEHAYLAEDHIEEDEPVAEFIVDWAWDSFATSRDALQRRVYAEASRFHPEILKRDQEELSRKGWTDIVELAAR
mmetsp:Transcript_18167/g.40134  ORF Transcript_18167/g.40134 Transcript_18167/m.40134 type:complete len:170 (-) Transcript_18167:78-587(-)